METGDGMTSETGPEILSPFYHCASVHFALGWPLFELRCTAADYQH